MIENPDADSQLEKLAQHNYSEWARANGAGGWWGDQRANVKAAWRKAAWEELTASLEPFEYIDPRGFVRELSFHGGHGAFL